MNKISKNLHFPKYLRLEQQYTVTGFVYVSVTQKQGNRENPSWLHLKFHYTLAHTCNNSQLSDSSYRWYEQKLIIPRARG